MTTKQIDQRIAKFNRALRAGQITPTEWEALMIALCRVARE